MTSLAAHEPMPQGALAAAGARLPALCHVTIVGPHKRADLALPSDIPLPHVMPGLLRALGEVDGESAAAPGWVLQRLGGTPFDLGQSLGALGVLDGEVLYLRPREFVLPPAMFDDVADVVATGIKEGRHAWSGRHTRLLGTGASCALLVAGAPTLALSGAAPAVVAVVAGVLALLLLLAAASLSRALGHSGAGAALGYSALPYGFLAGLLAPAGPAGLAGLGAPHLLAAFACVAFVAAVGGAAVADGVPGFLGTAIASVAGTVCAAIVMVFDVPAAGAAAVAASLLLAFSPIVPSLAFRLARVPLPSMPTTAEELRADNDRVDSASILERTGQAQRYATGIVAGIGLAVLAAQPLLVLDEGWIAPVMSLALSLTLVLRTRVFHGVAQRLWLMVPALAGIVLLAFTLSTRADGVWSVALVIGLMWAAAIPAGLGLWLPTGRPSPFWGRAGDIVDVMLTAGLFPLALGVLEVYAWIRGLSG
ncbi:type VII secretion integral membrane protein EccD [Microtetraspora malaysiensis]|uniref:type VII secretion integral membrane protein EccD n=1 Tax=Microtetraspora malaysiensis TaxID=161358 RepID=UPI003D906269